MRTAIFEITVRKYHGEITLGEIIFASGDIQPGIETNVAEYAINHPDKWAEILPLVDAGYCLHRHRVGGRNLWEAIRQGPKRGKWKRTVHARVAERMKRLGMLRKVES